MDLRRVLILIGLAFSVSDETEATEVPGRAMFFVDVTEAAGIAVEHGDQDTIATGAAAGDLDGDGWEDIYVIGGPGGRQHLFRNRGDGTFEELAVSSGVAVAGEHMFGPAFADIDGDFDLDLFVGGVSSAGPALFRNDGAWRFSEVSREGRMFPSGVYIGATFGDYDLDGDVDMFTTHWLQSAAVRKIEHLWSNDGHGSFSQVPSEVSGLVIETDTTDIGDIVLSFTGNFVDIDDDGRLDMLLASDYGHSQVFRNSGDGRFEDITSNVITDENGMGAAVGDYDNDGDLDWFVTSIFDPSGVPSEAWGASGNRMYRNVGGGVFEDATDEAGVRDGSWGWGACFADFDLDGDLDLFHVNGFIDFTNPARWLDKPARLFANQGDGSFVEVAAAAGIDDHGNGRGVVCFDYDRDGDIDVFISNVLGPARLYRNELTTTRGFLSVRLVGRPPNTEGIGARVVVHTAEARQLRHISSGNNYASQNPAVAHFGLDDAARVDSLDVEWPGGEVTRIVNIDRNRELVVHQDIGDVNCDGRATAADLTFQRAGFSEHTTRNPRCLRKDLDYNGVVDERDLDLVGSWIFGVRDVVLGGDGTDS